MEVKLTRVDNGWILQITKRDVLTNAPDQTVTIHATLEEALKQIEKSK